MASIIIPSRWRQQPIGLLEINWANPLARAIRLAAPLRDTKQVFSRDGIRLAATGASLGTCSRGVGAVFPGTSGNRIDLGTTPILTAGVPYTFSLLLRPATPSAFAVPIGLRFGTSEVLFIRGTNAGYMATIGPLSTSGVRNFNAAGAPTSGVEEHWIASNAVGPESTAVVAYFNGVSQAYIDSIYGSLSITNSYIGWGSTDDHWPGLIQNVVVWSRALSAPEAAEFYANPWQIYRKRSRVLYFETAGGGTIYNEPLEEVSTLVETYLGNVIYPTSFTETAGLVDSNQASNITNTTLTETESLQDSVAVIQTLGALLNESATLTDSNTVLTTFNPTLTEQTTLQDNNTVVTTFNTTITDSLTGIDNYTGLVVFNATITETLTDPDSYAAEVSVIINESVSGTDSYSVTVNYVTTLNETASVADTINTSWVCNATLTEIQTLVDSITAYISGEEPTSFDIVSLKSFITRMLPTNSKITTSITKNSKL